MPRKFLIAANWKMNPIPEGAFGGSYQGSEAVDVLVLPTFLDLSTCIENNLTVGAQTGHPTEHGAHSGDVSMAMLKALGCTHVMCGHSERRAHHHESNEDVAAQAQAALDCDLHPVVCIGETEAEREAGQAEAVVEAQLAPLPLEADITLAYEPVWAIGTGNTATPEMAQQMHAFIRDKLPNPDSTRILYGGSMKPENAKELLEQPDIDGGLVGGASLKPDAFAEIVTIAQNLS